jgi:SAM-dependent methyltransferase
LLHLAITVKKDIYSIWEKQALLREKNQVDALCKVLDASDTKGIKNSYIDIYLKYYVRKYLAPQKNDILLEVGCGIGRLTEYMSQFVHSVYGTDIIDKFIEDCRSNPRKNKNTFYLPVGETEKLKDIMINKMYIVWVLMYLLDQAEVISTLRFYRDCLPNLKTAVMIEQVKKYPQLDPENKVCYCCYRTIDEYKEIFAASGFRVKGYFVLGERYNGPVYKFIHIVSNFLPRALAQSAEKLFNVDKYLLGDNAKRSKLINNKKPTDVLFYLETTD